MVYDMLKLKLVDFCTQLIVKKLFQMAAGMMGGRMPPGMQMHPHHQVHPGMHNPFMVQPGNPFMNHMAAGAAAMNQMSQITAMQMGMGMNMNNLNNLNMNMGNPMGMGIPGMITGFVPAGLQQQFQHNQHLQQQQQQQQAVRPLFPSAAASAAAVASSVAAAVSSDLFKIFG